MDSPQPLATATYGSFIGQVVTRWLDDGRLMELTEDFAYLDSSFEKWLAPKGSRVDGASIPRVLWTPIGSPFEGQYRNASVLHDVACVAKVAPWYWVHQMFYEAMRCGGVGEVRALAMYAAVYKFGPRWKNPSRFAEIGKIVGGGFAQYDVPTTVVPPENLLEQLEAGIQEQNIQTPHDAAHIMLSQ